MKVLFLVFGALWLGWVFYVAATHLMKLRGELGLVATAFGWSVVGPGIVYDVVVLNWVCGSVVCLDLPRWREWTLTARLKRLQVEGGWRAAEARWICVNLLNPFTKDGHC